MTALTDPVALGPVRLPNRVVLAPLAGIGNWFVRLQARRFGAGLRLMRQHGELALWVTQHISQDYASTCREIRDLILSDSASEKLARLLVGWLDQNTEARNPSQMKLALTHEEIGQMIGTSRETVSRLFAGFKKQHLIQQSGATLVIPNRIALESLITA